MVEYFNKLKNVGQILIEFSKKLEIGVGGTTRDRRVDHKEPEKPAEPS